MASEVTLSKNSITVTIGTVSVDDNYDNKLFVITPATAPASASAGPAINQIINLMRITHQLLIRGKITASTSAGKTAVQVKQDLINMFKGAQTNGGPVNLTYEGYSGGIDGQIQKVTFSEIPTDESASNTSDDIVKYDVQLTFIDGKDAGT